MGKNNACLPNIEAILAMGIDPKTGLPLKMGGKKAGLKQAIKIQLRNVDEQDAVNRFVWSNIPMDISSQFLERMLYYRGQLCFWYSKELNQFFISPYALDGNIDAYGRYQSIRPVPFTGGTDEKNSKFITDYFAKKKLNVVHGVKMGEVTLDDLENSAVLLYDYTQQLTQQILPRAQMNDALLDTMSDCIPFMRTNLLLSTGVRGVRVHDADQAASVLDGSRSMENAALTGDPLVPIVGNVEFQDLTNGQTAKSEEFMLAMQSLDNFRLSTYGIDNGGLFEKKAHELQSEADINGGPVGLILQDGLSQRQNFCNIVNSIWGLGIWCEPAENIMGADLNGDGLMYDRNDDAANSGTEVTSNEGGEENE